MTTDTRNHKTTAKRVKVPRASIAVTLLDDPEYIDACQTPEGKQAIACFVALIAAAKVQANDGAFRDNPASIAMMIRWPLNDYCESIQYLIRCKWVIKDSRAKTIRIKSYSKWNSWGGKRENAGRKSRFNQDANQDAIKCIHSDSDPVSDSYDAEASSSGKDDARAVVHALESRLGRNVTASEMDRLVRMEATIESDPIEVGGKPVDAQEVMLRAIAAMPADVRIWHRYLASIIEGIRADGVFPAARGDPGRPVLPRALSDEEFAAKGIPI